MAETGCQVVVDKTMQVCEALDTVEVQAGCVHGHIRKGRVCDKHVKEIGSGKTFCRACYEIHGHACRMALYAGVAVLGRGLPSGEVVRVLQR
ncbi:hypothetical protein [Nonomuraea basaltis]|uniref:hypothetical protein n=1 Tax=Nonomuraea basaltis TaxID=2495887 RepID=UPI00110C42C0|nr:hypothetical protein [Nonomuraea basaltis]TMR99544.1 hypothetical protein EJK15_06955 [Nonomuraea basaltis]